MDGVTQSICAGDSIGLPAGCCHTVVAESKAKLIEVQLGNDIWGQDKENHPFS